MSKIKKSTKTGDRNKVEYKKKNICSNSIQSDCPFHNWIQKSSKIGDRNKVKYSADGDGSS